MGKKSDNIKMEGEVQMADKPNEVIKNNPKVDNKVASNKGILFSRLDHAESYTYGRENCMIAPKGKITVDDVNLVGKPLAKGLILRKIG